MAGNSLRSDVLPIVSIGGHAVHIPYELTWDYEKVAEGTVPKSGYEVIESITELPNLIVDLHA
jgi:putative hydrolase of the HAD superfamily